MSVSTTQLPFLGAAWSEADSLIPVPRGCGASLEERQCSECGRTRNVYSNRQHTRHWFFLPTRSWWWRLLNRRCKACTTLQQCGCCYE